MQQKSMKKAWKILSTIPPLQLPQWLNKKSRSFYVVAAGASPAPRLPELLLGLGHLVPPPPDLHLQHPEAFEGVRKSALLLTPAALGTGQLRVKTIEGGIGGGN